MQHLEDIKVLIGTLQSSPNFHALVIESPPGWAKSSTVEQILVDSGIEFTSLGSFSTPLYLYNSICKWPDKLLLLDDCAGLFSESSAMAILKAATWSSVGSHGQRRVTWGSSSDRAKEESVNFSGKMILLTNTLPTGRDIEAFLSRTLYLRIAFDADEVEQMLIEAARSPEHYGNTELALEVVSHLVSGDGTNDLRRISLRTLKMAYEIATTNPTGWKHLLDRLLPKVSAKAIAGRLSGIGGSVEEQARQFSRQTGLSRRTFFNYRNGENRADLIVEPAKVQVAQVCALVEGAAGG